MRYALDKNGNKICADDAQKDGEYFCQLCKTKMILRKGMVNVAHFAHKSNKECDPWYEPKGMWHVWNQNLFTQDCIEVPIIEDGEKHIADVYIEKYKTIIEFQHSPITKEVFEERNNFYTKNGRRIIWVFDFSEKDTIEQMDSVFAQSDQFLKFRWKHRSKFIESAKGNKNIDLIFYINQGGLQFNFLTNLSAIQCDKRRGLYNGYLHVTWSAEGYKFFGGYGSPYYGNYNKMLNKLIRQGGLNFAVN